MYDNVKEKNKFGDDFPARLYVVYQKGYFKWSTVAINYVWSSQHPAGETWDSPYTSKSKIVVLQTGDAKTGTWISERRNVSEDFKKYFNVDVTKLNGFAIMVDGDNTNASGMARFSDISFNGN